MASDPLFSVPDAMLRSYGLRRNASDSVAYYCVEPGAVMVPVVELRGPTIAPGVRGLERRRLERVIRDLSRGEPLSAIPLYREPGAALATVLDGVQRLAVLTALGFRAVWCRYVSRNDAELFYRYPKGQL